MKKFAALALSVCLLQACTTASKNDSYEFKDILEDIDQICAEEKDPKMLDVETPYAAKMFPIR